MKADLLAGTARLVAGATVRWLGTRPGAGRRVYVANHTSHLDFVVLWSAFPRDLRPAIRPVAAADYWLTGPTRRYLAREVFKAVLIDRSSPTQDRPEAGPGEAIARMLEALDEGCALILFPEGTRGDGTTIAPFRSGLFHLCRARPGLEVVPVYLENFNRLLPKGRVLPVPILTRITFGPPLQLEPGEDRRAFLDRARDAVARLHDD